MGPLLTLDGAKQSSPAVTAWLETKYGEKGALARHVKLKPAEVIDAAALERLIVVAHEDIHMRLRHHAGRP